MLPGMAAKPRVAIVGAGNWGTALALALRAAGYQIVAVVARSGGTSSGRAAVPASLKKARSLARQVGARVVVDLSEVNAKLVWFCVPDDAIAGAARSLADKVEWKGRVALHSSGALSGDELGELRRRGAVVASVHPMMTFVREAYSVRSSLARSSFVRSSASKSQNMLAGVPFALEGDAAAVRLARRLVRDVGGRAYAISKKDKAAYHAWGTFTALLATTERAAQLAGVNRSEAKRRMLPILQQTLANYAALGAGRGFSGPIVRGDVETVKGHLRALRSVGVAREVYSALALAALEYLPTKNRRLLKQLLESRST
jgi:predicted short-subunit dehydrogenase-like oxidoreductase (DUF2520 family)